MIIPETVTSNEIQDRTISGVDISNEVPIKTIPQHPRINQQSTIDSAGDVGQYTSITIGTDGLPIISYLKLLPPIDLKVAHCNDITCTSAFTATIDSDVAVGGYTSITIGTDGLPIISYKDFTNEDLKVAHCNSVFCFSAVANTIDAPATAEVGRWTSITIGTDGLPIISYFDQSTNNDLKVAHCDDVTCTSGVANTIDAPLSVGLFTSITIGTDGLPIISYHELFSPSDLKVAHCNDVTCTSAFTATIDSGGDVGQWTSITIGTDGLPIISYWDGTNRDLKVAHCNDVTCTGAATSTIDSGGDVGEYTSITIGTDGLPIISYYDNTNKDLKVAHCGNEYCIPNWTRR